MPATALPAPDKVLVFTTKIAPANVDPLAVYLDLVQYPKDKTAVSIVEVDPTTGKVIPGGYICTIHPEKGLIKHSGYLGRLPATDGVINEA